MYPFQKDVLKQLHENDEIIVLKSRQLGLSTLSAAYALWMMVFFENKNILALATKQGTAKNIIKKIQFAYRYLPKWLTHGKKPIEDNKLNLTLWNNSQALAVAASDDAGRSEAVSFLIVDEAAFIRNIETIYGAASQTVATGGKRIILSTPNGVNNWFHKKWEDSITGRNSFVPIKLHWTVHPERDEKWRKKQDEDLGPRLAAQECDTDFLTSGDTYFESEDLKYYLDNVKDPIRKELGNDLWIWKEPEHNKNYSLVADVARGDSKDNSTFHIIEQESNEQVVEFQGKIGTRQFAKLIDEWGRKYNKAIAIVENNNMGWDAVQTLIQLQYPNLYYTPKEDKMKNISKTDWIYRMDYPDKFIPGFQTTKITRPLLLDELYDNIRNRKFIINSIRTISEMQVFLWIKGKPQASSGYNDDLVIPLGVYLFTLEKIIYFNSYSSEEAEVLLDNISVSHNYNDQSVENNEIIEKNNYNPNLRNIDPRLKDENFDWLLG